jgi:hypothetical protein
VSGQSFQQEVVTTLITISCEAGVAIKLIRNGEAIPGFWGGNNLMQIPTIVRPEF